MKALIPEFFLMYLFCLQIPFEKPGSEASFRFLLTLPSEMFYFCPSVK